MIKSVAISAASMGNNTLVAAVTGKIIRVLSFVLVGGGTVTAKFQSAASGTDLTGAMSLVAASVVTSPPPVFTSAGLQGQFECNVSELLNLNLSSGVQVSGYLTYQLITA